MTNSKFQEMKIKTLVWVTFFAVSMGFFESSVVIYIRQIVYPGGFVFPLQPLPKNLLTTEVLREAFSLLMLLSVGILAGRSAITKFAWFIYSFAVWDIFYYIFLKILTGWPESFMTTDILFLLPVIWVGPVVSPLILSLIMILFALLIHYFSSIHRQVQLKIREILFLTAGALVIVISFTEDYARFIFKNYSFEGIRKLTSESLLQLSFKYYPGNFDWIAFAIGVIFILAGIGLFAKRIILTNDQ
jgi:hypothetical protein